MELKSKLNDYQNLKIEGHDLVNLENLDGPGGGVGRLRQVNEKIKTLNVD